MRKDHIIFVSLLKISNASVKIMTFLVMQASLRVKFFY